MITECYSNSWYSEVRSTIYECYIVLEYWYFIIVIRCIAVVRTLVQHTNKIQFIKLTSPCQWDWSAVHFDGTPRFPCCSQLRLFPPSLPCRLLPLFLIQIEGWWLQDPQNWNPTPLWLLPGRSWFQHCHGDNDGSVSPTLKKSNRRHLSTLQRAPMINVWQSWEIQGHCWRMVVSQSAREWWKGSSILGLKGNLWVILCPYLFLPTTHHHSCRRHLSWLRASGMVDAWQSLGRTSQIPWYAWHRTRRATNWAGHMWQFPPPAGDSGLRWQGKTQDPFQTQPGYLILFGHVIHLQDRGPIGLVHFVGVQGCFFAENQSQLEKLLLRAEFLPRDCFEVLVVAVAGSVLSLSSFSFNSNSCSWVVTVKGRISSVLGSFISTRFASFPPWRTVEPHVIIEFLVLTCSHGNTLCRSSCSISDLRRLCRPTTSYIVTFRVTIFDIHNRSIDGSSEFGVWTFRSHCKYVIFTRRIRRFFPHW